MTSKREKVLVQALCDALRVMANWDTASLAEKTRVQLNAAALAIKPGPRKRHSPEVLTEDVKALFERGQAIIKEAQAQSVPGVPRIWPEGAVIDRGPEETEDERMRR